MVYNLEPCVRTRVIIPVDKIQARDIYDWKKRIYWRLNGMEIRHVC